MNEKMRVVIHVSGGVAYVAVCPPEVEVEIIDEDDLLADEEEARATLTWQAVQP